jgi:seryl-tRNA synthetase
MLDNKYFRQNLPEAASQLKRRGFELDIKTIEQLELQRKHLQVKMQELQNERNTRSKMIGQAKIAGQDIQPLLNDVDQLGKQLKAVEQQTEQVLAELNTLQLSVPNILHASVPDGMSENDNVEVRRWGTPREFDFPIKDHVDLGEALSQMDFAAATKITGSRFVVLKGQLAKLHRALIQFMLDVQTKEHGYQEVYVPYIVNHDSLYGTGQLPKFMDDQFNLKGEWNYSLIPTAEVPVTNLVRDEIIDEIELPLKWVAHTPCFRSEAGSYGKDTRGLIRQHQFEKVEMVRIVKPVESYQHLEELVKNAENILQKLEIPYRVITLCAGDIGFASAKTYDIEAWIPSQNTYREISSCSNFEDFQARRLKARWRNPATGKPELVHTLNGSGLPAGRTLVALMENYQDKEGNIHLPKVLQPYMNGETMLKRF